MRAVSYGAPALSSGRSQYQPSCGALSHVAAPGLHALWRPRCSTAVDQPHRRAPAVVAAAANFDDWGGDDSAPSKRQQQNGGRGRGQRGGSGGGRGRGGGRRREWDSSRSQQQQQQSGRDPPPRFDDDAAPRRGAHPSRRQQQQQGNAKAGNAGSGGSSKRDNIVLFGGNSSSSGADQGASTQRDGASAAAMLLTRQIMSAPDWPALEAVLADRIFGLNAVHISAALHQLSRIVGSKGLAALPFATRRQVALVVEALLERAEEVQGDMGGQELSCCVGALARLAIPHQRHVERLIAASGGRLGTYRNKELGHLGWAAARLGYVPPKEWLDEFHDETFDRMASLNEQELGNSLWAFAKWGRPPSDEWLERFMARLPSSVVALEPPAICSVLWAAVMLGLKLPPALVDAVLLESQVKFPAFSAHGLATLAWSLCSLDVRPRRLWLDDYVRHVGARMSGWGNDQCFTNTLWALSNWEHRPPDAWLDDCCRLSAPFLEQMTLRSLLIIATALADLDHSPSVEWSSLVLERVHALLTESNNRKTESNSQNARGSRADGPPGAATPPAGGAADVATFVWALSRLLRRPRAGAGGQQQQQQAAAGSSGGSDGSEGPSAAWLKQYRPLLQDLADIILAGMPQLPVPALVDAAVGFADLRFFPGEPWMDAHETAVNDAVSNLSAYQFNLVQGAYERLERAWAAQQQQAAAAGVGGRGAAASGGGS